jgi:hypothetical protein
MGEDRKIRIICEGSEETNFLDILKEKGYLTIPHLDITYDVAPGYGSVGPMFHTAFSSGEYDAIFAFVDVDNFKTPCYKKVESDLKSILGFDPKNVIIFTNPCTLQLEVIGIKPHIRLSTSSKAVNDQYVKQCWPEWSKTKTYDAKKWQRDKIFFSLTEDKNFERMMQNIPLLSTNIVDLPSTSIQKFFNLIHSGDLSLIDKIMFEED